VRKKITLSMNTRHYLMFDGTTYAIWESDPSGSGIRELQEKKPWFEMHW